MKAVVMNEFGGPDVLVPEEVAKPSVGVNEVLVRVHATSVNPIDTKIRESGSWAVQPPAILGYDVSGVIAAVGEGVVEFSVGDEVVCPQTPQHFHGVSAWFRIFPQVSDEKVRQILAGARAPDEG